MPGTAIDADALRRDLDPVCAVYPAGWPGRALPFDPGDFAQAFPQGFGFSVPLALRPWDRDLQSAAEAQSVYGWRAHGGDPVRNAPQTLPNGGVVYFGDPRSGEEIDSIVRTLGLVAEAGDFAVFCGCANDVEAEAYLHQIRIVPRAKLESLFGASATDVRPPHPATLGEIARAFVAREKNHWYSDEVSLSGLAGGDGDWAKEALAFGLWVENGEHRVVRLWSRAWLVTK